MTFRLAETDKEILSQYASQIHMSLAEFSRNLIAIGFQEYTLEQEALNNEIHYENK